MHVILRRIALWILADELAEREANAHKLATEAYQTGPRASGKKGRIWWNGYEQAIHALRESRRAM